jgi:probable addiction module antidote protein
MKSYRTHKEYLLERLKNRARAGQYLQVALEEFESDADMAGLLLALRDVVEAQGGMTKLSREADLNRANLYAALSENGNPRFETIMAILKTLGMRLCVKQIEQRKEAEPAKAEAS